MIIFNQQLMNFEKLYVLNSSFLKKIINSLQITINDRDHHIKLTASDDENQRLILKHKEDIKDHELKANRDAQRLKDAHLSTEQALKEQITKLENIRTSLEHVEIFIHLFNYSCFLLISGNKFIKINCINTKIKS
jgi:hypothetical protein